MRIGRQQLSVLLNRLYDRGDERFTIAHPSEAVGDLVSIELGEPDSSTVRFTKRRDAYANARDDVRRTHGDRVAGDLPKPDEYVKAAMAAGIVPVENVEEIRAFLDRYGDPDLMAGHRPVFAGFDTNLLAWRIDRVLGLRDPDGGVGYVNGFVLASGVRDELDWDVKCDDTDPYVDAWGPAFEAYWTQPTGSGRISRLGLLGYRGIRDVEHADEIQCERGDAAIVEAYDAWESDARGEIMLFSNDRTFVERAHGHTILAQHVEVPRDLPRKETATWRELETLLYTLTILFGVLSLPGVTLRGVWRGKDELDWQRERLRLDPRSTTLEPQLECDLAIVDAYEALPTE